MKAKGLMVMILVAMLAGCAGMGGETSGSSGASTTDQGASQEPDIFRSYVN